MAILGRSEAKLTGFGGQGIVLAGIILARAAMYDGKEVTQTQSYGPEARGGACQSGVVISSEPILYPFADKPDIMIAMSQEALEKHIDSLKKGGKLIVDSDLIHQIPKKSGIKINKIAATSIAEEKLGRGLLANIIMLGALSSLTNIVSKEALQRAVRESVPKGTEELNLRALAEGFSNSEKSVIVK